MEAGTKQVEAGVATTQKAGTSLQEIISDAQQVGDMISQIATAATQQSSTAEQINSNVEQIAKIAKASSAGTQQEAQACQNLSNLAVDLQQLVGGFQLESASADEGGGKTTSVRQKSPRKVQPVSGLLTSQTKGFGAVRNRQDNEAALVH
jgi:ABC-type transporter Mla subunit MlaD